MRTKTLLLMAALSAASVATSMAQVYSVNAVGYYNVTITNYNNGKELDLLANQLSNGNNNIATVLPNAPDSCLVFIYNGAGFDTETSFGPGTWVPGTNVLAPGKAFFLSLGGVGTPTTTFTFVGEVPQGLRTIPIKAGFNYVGSHVPQAGALTATLGDDQGVDGDNAFVYRPHTGAYDTLTFFGSATPPAAGPGQYVPDATLAVGQGVIINNSGNAYSWTRTFNVNP